MSTSKLTSETGKFKSIESFRRVYDYIKYVTETHELTVPTIRYKGNVKLHGSNVGIVRDTDGKIYAQSRRRKLSVGNDNFRTALYVQDNYDALEDFFDYHFPDTNEKVYMYGEVIGKGVCSKVAISKLDYHIVLFSVRIGDEYQQNKVEYQNHSISLYNILEIPQFEIDVDFTNPQSSIDQISEWTLEVEESCPWASYPKKVGTAEGIGEGIVWIPSEVVVGDVHMNEDMWFKTKGLKHKKSAKKKVEICPIKSQNISDCVDIILPEWRLEQGINELSQDGITLDIRNIGRYIKWVNQDVIKEETDVIEANNFTWKEVSKEVTRRTKEYYMSQLTQFDI